MATKSATRVAGVYDNKPERFTSYGNQRALAMRDLGQDVECIHGATFYDGCSICRMSGSVLVNVPR